MTAPERDGCRVGIDLVAVGDIAEALAAHGERYLRRIFTEHELESCRTPSGWSHDSLAARWAAKEATIKVLRPADHLPEWTTMEVRRQPDGSCDLALTDTAAAMADAAGISSLALSLTHEGPYAAAVVFALCRRDGAGSADDAPASDMTSHSLDPAHDTLLAHTQGKEHAHA